MHGSGVPIKKIPIFAQNNITLIPTVNVSISRYFSITVSALIVEEISGEEPELCALITCIMLEARTDVLIILHGSPLLTNDPVTLNH